ncbi:MAG: PepSY domain-containing protein [Longimicrobiales bacterium]
MKRVKLFTVLGVVAAVGVGMAAFKANDQQAQQAALQAKANITEAQARALALAAVPGGTIVESELEDEDGQLAYTFDITVPGQAGTSEVSVDAITGKVSAVKQDTDDEENEDDSDSDDGGAEQEGAGK